MEYILWQEDTKNISQEFKQAMAAFQRRTGRPPVLILIRAMSEAVNLAGVDCGVKCVESKAVAPGTFWVAGEVADG
jgi:hypothetical protein